MHIIATLINIQAREDEIIRALFDGLMVFLLNSVFSCVS
jgi:hypothetical protein